MPLVDAFRGRFKELLRRPKLEERRRGLLSSSWAAVPPTPPTMSSDRQLCGRGRGPGIYASALTRQDLGLLASRPLVVWTIVVPGESIDSFTLDPRYAARGLAEARGAALPGRSVRNDHRTVDPDVYGNDPKAGARLDSPSCGTQDEVVRATGCASRRWTPLLKRAQPQLPRRRRRARRRQPRGRHPGYAA
jgi:hypothetical protein